MLKYLLRGDLSAFDYCFLIVNELYLQFKSLLPICKLHCMREFENTKLIELVSYILNKTGGLSRYHIFKILYFAEMKHLSKWGISFVPDSFHALQYGPVPTMLYDAVKELGNPVSKLAVELATVAEMAGEDAHDYILPSRSADLDYISKSEQEALDESVDENAHLSFNELKIKSHDFAWREAYQNGKTKAISPVSMAMASGASPEVIEYIREQIELEDALSL